MALRSGEDFKGNRSHVTLMCREVILGHHPSFPVPALSVSRACHPGSIGINPVYACNLLLFLPQTVPARSRGKA